MAIVLSDNIQVNAPKPIDSRYSNNLVPYSDVSIANAAIVSGVRYTGLTINVGGNEYWYKNGITDPDLIIKLGGGSAITGATNGLSIANNNITFGGELTGITTITAIDTTSLTFTDNRTTPVGIQYAADYSTGFTDNSLVSKLYVDTGITGSSNIVGVCNVYVNYTATTSSDFIGVSGATEIWLPVAPKACQRITVVDICGNALSAAITVWGNGKCIIGNSYSTINTDYGSTTFVNNGYFWSAVAFIN